MVTSVKCLTADPESCVLVVHFEREYSKGDDWQVMVNNFKRGTLSVDPRKDLTGAVIEQFRQELQAAYDATGMNGLFSIASFIPGVALSSEDGTCAPGSASV